MFQTSNEKNSDKLVWTKYVPISVSVCSNFPGYTKPHCIVDLDIDVLVQSMVEYMTEITGTVEKMPEEKWENVVKQIRKKISNQANDVSKIREDQEDGEEDEDVECDEKDESLLSLLGQFRGYMIQVPVLGFNSARYDLNLVKQNLARHLNMHDEEHTFVVKKPNEYTCISFPRLKCLDKMQFLAPGTPYITFLKAYGVEEQNGFVPYEWLT